MIQRICQFALVALLVPLAPAFGQAVHVVDELGGPGSEFTNIAVAITSADPGDVVLVKGGDYSDQFLTVRKSIMVIADAGHSASIGAFDISHLDAGEFAVVKGFTQDWYEVWNGTLLNNAGPVWIEDLVSNPRPSRLGGGGFDIEACDTVLMVDCTLAAPLFNGLTRTLETVTAVNSWLGIRGSDVVGGSDGGHGLRVVTSSLELIDSTVAGGDGLDGGGCISICCQGEDGGHGVGGESGSELMLLDATVTRGLRGNPMGINCNQNTASHGVPFVLSNSTTATLPGDARRFEIPSPARESQLVSMTFQGLPGDVVWLIYGSQPSVARTPRQATGAVYLPPGHEWLRMGTIGPSGTLTVDGPAPTIPAGTEAQYIFIQALFHEPSASRFILGPTRSFCVLSASL